MTPPDFVIVGAMRAGTTSLTAALRAQPGIFMSAQKELHYFDLHHDRGPAWYAAHFREAPAGALRGEATPNYLYVREARERLAAELPHARLIAVLRHPAERAWSHYLHNWYRKRDVLSFEDALDAEAGRLRSHPEPWRYAYVDKGRYARQLQDLTARLADPDSLLVVLFDELVAEPHRVLTRVAAHLGTTLDPALTQTLPETNRSSLKIRSVAARDAARRLPKPLRDAVGRLNSTEVARPSMSDGTRQRLDEEFAEGIAELEQLLTVDLCSWRGTPRSS